MLFAFEQGFSAFDELKYGTDDQAVFDCFKCLKNSAGDAAVLVFTERFFAKPYFKNFLCQSVHGKLF